MKKLYLPLMVIAGLLSVTSCGKVKGEISLDELPNTCEIHTDLQIKALNDDYKNILNYVQGTSEESRPKPITLSWNCEGFDASSYEVLVSENEDMSDPYKFTSDTNSLDVYNLKIKTTYYWNVSAISENGCLNSATSSFTTTSLPIRNIYVDGVTNFRDIGGWTIDDTHVVKQGMLYRCGRLNVSSTDEVEECITEEGKNTLNNFLHIKSEIDLRKSENNEVGSITSCVAGDNINYLNAPIAYVKPILKSNIDSWIQIFEYLGNKDNYPIMYHCNIGTDRTGVMTYLILGLLGVDLEDIYVDYCFSNFAYIEQYRDYSSMTTSIGGAIKNQEAETLSGKIYSYLTSQGVSNTALDNLIQMMTEEVK